MNNINLWYIHAFNINLKNYDRTNTENKIFYKQQLIDLSINIIELIKIELNISI